MYTTCTQATYRIAGIFQGGKIFVVFVVEKLTTKFLPTKQYHIVPGCGLVYRDHKNFSTNWPKIHCLRKFYPPNNTCYTVHVHVLMYMYMYNIHVCMYMYVYIHVHTYVHACKCKRTVHVLYILYMHACTCTLCLLHFPSCSFSLPSLSLPPPFPSSSFPPSLLSPLPPSFPLSLPPSFPPHSVYRSDLGQ